MSVKLVSMNLGVRLTLEVDGKIQDVEWSAVCPAPAISQPSETLQLACDFLNQAFGTDMFIDSATYKTIQIAKRPKIKAHKPMSQAEYNRRIQELGK